jgi:hypothetical protein
MIKTCVRVLPTEDPSVTTVCGHEKMWHEHHHARTYCSRPGCKCHAYKAPSLIRRIKWILSKKSLPASAA